MSPETQNKLDRVKRTSARLRTVCACLLALTALLWVAATAVIVAGGGVTVRSFDLLVPVASLSLPARLAVAAIVALSLTVIAKGLYHLLRLFTHYAAGDFFTIQAAGQIRQLGITAILWAGIHIVWLVAVTRLSPPEWLRPLPLNLDSLFFGVVIIVISWFMSAAAEMREENDLTI